MLCVRVASIAGLALSSALGQNSIYVGVPLISLSATVGKPITSIASIGINGGVPGVRVAAVQFRYTGATPAAGFSSNPPNFVVVFPSSGTTSIDANTSTQILIGLNDTVVKGMRPGRYGLDVRFSTVDQSPPSQTKVLAFLQISAPPPPAVTSVVNNATYQGSISPGTIVSIFGSNLGPETGPTQYDDTGAYPTELVQGDDSGVKIGGIAAPLLYISPSRVDAIVPSGLAGQSAADLILSRYNRSTDPFTVSLLDTSPGVYTADQSGSGQGAISNLVLAGGIGPYRQILSSTPNSASNPAPKGSPISLLVTGFGRWDPPLPHGLISLTTGALSVAPALLACGYLPVCRRPAAPVSLTIGGKPATIFYASAAPYKPWSVLQVNAYVPDDVDSGPQPILLTVGNNDNSQQNVTVAIE